MRSLWAAALLLRRVRSERGHAAVDLPARCGLQLRLRRRAAPVQPRRRRRPALRSADRPRRVARPGADADGRVRARDRRRRFGPSGSRRSPGRAVPGVRRSALRGPDPPGHDRSLPRRGSADLRDAPLPALPGRPDRRRAPRCRTLAGRPRRAAAGTQPGGTGVARCTGHARDGDSRPRRRRRSGSRRATASRSRSTGPIRWSSESGSRSRPPRSRSLGSSSRSTPTPTTGWRTIRCCAPRRRAPRIARSPLRPATSPRRCTGASGPAACRSTTSGGSTPIPSASTRARSNSCGSTCAGSGSPAARPAPRPPRRSSYVTGLPRILDGYVTQLASSESILSIAAIGPFALAAGAMAMVAAAPGRPPARDAGADPWPRRVGFPRARNAALGVDPARRQRLAAGAPRGGRRHRARAQPCCRRCWRSPLASPAVLLLVGASWTTARRPLGQIERDDPPVFRVAPRRLVIELTIVVIAIAATLLLRQRGLTVGASDDEARFDPLLASVPVLAGLAAGIVALRLYPLPIRAPGLACRSTARHRPGAGPPDDRAATRRPPTCRSSCCS